jgi:hypothetical protein
VDTQLPARDLDLPLEGRLEVTLGQLDSGTQNLSRENPEAHYTLGIPGNMQVLREGSFITLITSHFPATPDKPSALEVEVNGRLLSAITLNPENASSHKTHIDLPSGILSRQINEIVVRLETGATCDNPGAILKVVVDERSTLSLGYRQTAYLNALERFPLPFSEQSLLSIPVTIVLTDEHTDAQLAAATTLAASLGKATAGKVDLRAIPSSEFDEQHADHHIILIGKPREHALLDALEPAAAITNIILEPDQGFLEQRTSPWNEQRVLLIVSGRNDRGIREASRALSYRIRPDGIRGAKSRVGDITLPEGSPGAPPPQSYTLASPDGGDQTFYGTRHQESVYPFTLPPGWKSTGPSVLTLRFSHASTLDPEKSVLDVRLNDQPVGSTFLDQSNAVEGKWEVSLPQRSLRAGENQLRIGLGMTLPGADETDRCRMLDDQRLWTVLDQRSQVSVPYAIINPQPNLTHLPYPFGQDSGLSQTLFVLPEEYGAVQSNDVVLLAAHLGAVVKNDHLAANVLSAAKVAQEDWQNHNLILLGRPTQNVLLRQFNDSLPWRFVRGSDTLARASSGDPGLRLQLDEDATVGLIQVAQSPWNKARSILALTGPTDAGALLAVRTLLNPGKSLRGNLVVIESRSPESNNPHIQITDTRPTSAETPTIPGDGDPGDPSSIPTMSSSDKILLAESWWK